MIYSIYIYLNISFEQRFNRKHGNRPFFTQTRTSSSKISSPSAIDFRDNPL